MFYSQFILAKKGPLGTIWIAAHLERKLRKNQVADTDIGVSVDSILFPEVPIALRLSSHLLLGVVRIYSRKVNYLFDDCSEALLKVKQAFRSTAVDLPPEQSKAPYHSITLPETFDLDDFELPDNEIFQGNFVDHHVSTREQITLQDNMDGVVFPTSQFGPDERFGDGDASQIGLDLDEDLFMDKGEVAGTSGILICTDADPQASAKEASSFIGDVPTERVIDASLASPANHFNIQAPSTPGLTEEPNLPSAQEAVVSDDHMDEDQNPSELAAKEVSGTASSQSEPSNLGSVVFHPNGNCHHMDEQKDEKLVQLGTECMELISSGNAQLPTSVEKMEATTGVDSVESILSRKSLGNEINVATDIQSEGFCDVDIGINGTTVPMTGNAIVMEFNGSYPCAGSGKTDLNPTYPSMPDNRSENDKSSVGPGALGTVETDMIVVSSDFETQKVIQPCLNPKVVETVESNIGEKSPAFTTPLQACNSQDQHACNGIDNSLDASNLAAEDDRLCSLGLSGRVDTTHVSGNSADVQDVMKPTSKADQIAHEVIHAADSNIGGQLDSLISEKNNLEKENSQISDFPPPEVLLSMPSPPGGRPDSFLVECTPGNEVHEEDGDAAGEKLISGRKRSYTESTLTMQSLNSVESSGAAQSKGTVEFIPDDDDLLSSILAGRRSTTLKMKPTPPVASSTVTAKRQRTAVRSSAHKRKVLVDDNMVLHGDTIRQQLTNTEDIRRVRKKAPCTHLEVWMLQKQFLEDEVFSEPVFTGMSSALTSLDGEAFDFNRIRIVLDDRSKGAIDTDNTPRAGLGEETNSVETVVTSVDRGEGLQECGGVLLETPCVQELTLVDGSTLQKGMDTVDDGVIKEMQYEVSGEKVEIGIADVRTPAGGANNFVASGAEPTSSVGPVSEVSCNSTDVAKVDSPSLNKTNDFVASAHTDASCQLVDQRCVVQSTEEHASTVEGVTGGSIRDQEEDGVSEKLDSDKKSDGKYLLEKTGLDTHVVMRDFQNTCSSPVYDVSVTDSVALEDRICPTSDQVIECQLDEPGKASEDEVLALDLRYDGSKLTSDNLISEDVKLDSSYSVEADLSSQNMILNERENIEYSEVDPNIVVDSTPMPTECIDAAGHAEFGTDAIEHNTDFLNVDDDDVPEDDESDMPNPEEKRILDNTGWSARTRAVANYLQVLFEKEAQPVKKVISLDSLLAGKSRKEASRMFFETLVLKTKDYIEAEQESCFCDIKIKPKGKLMISEF